MAKSQSFQHDDLTIFQHSKICARKSYCLVKPVVARHSIPKSTFIHYFQFTFVSSCQVIDCTEHLWVEWDIKFYDAIQLQH